MNVLHPVTPYPPQHFVFRHCRLKSATYCQCFTCMLDYGVLRFQFDGACSHMMWLASVFGALFVDRSIEFFVFISHQQFLLFWVWSLFYLCNLEAANVSLFRWMYEDRSNIDSFFFLSAGVVDVSQMIKQFYSTSGHSWDINIISVLNIRLDAKISNSL